MKTLLNKLPEITLFILAFCLIMNNKDGWAFWFLFWGVIIAFENT